MARADKLWAQTKQIIPTHSDEHSLDFGTEFAEDAHGYTAKSEREATNKVSDQEEKGAAAGAHRIDLIPVSRCSWR